MIQHDIRLTVGSQALTIDVTAESGTLVQSEAPVRGGTIEEGRITELPISSRNPAMLALTLPGVSSNRGGFGVGTFSVNGARSRSNNFLMDGVANNDMAVAGQGLQITNPDAVQEVSVQTSNYDAEFGRAGGGVINVITRAGTNSYHGTLSYLLDSTRDDALTACNHVQSVTRGYPAFGIRTSTPE
jgi:outer membrane receptor protein involved in Fe transport